MPRLVGKRSNGTAPLLLLLLVTAGAITGLEYVGAVNLIPGFGKEYTNNLDASSSSHRRPGVVQSDLPANRQSANKQYGQPGS